MNELRYRISGTLTRCRDVTLVGDGDDLSEELATAVLGTIATDVMVTVGDVTMHLGAWMDPDHWSQDWEETGVEDVNALLAGALEGRSKAAS